jgi:hypothetical protein
MAQVQSLTDHGDSLEASRSADNWFLDDILLLSLSLLLLLPLLPAAPRQARQEG